MLYPFFCTKQVLDTLHIISLTNYIPQLDANKKLQLSMDNRCDVDACGLSELRVMPARSYK